MGGKLNMFVFISLVVAAMLHGSSAQTTHVVGDGLGWLVPPGGDAAYQTWAASKTFTVGDVLVFNFTANAHDVAEVSKEAFDSCNATNPISLSTTTPTNITLTSAGEHHFICTIGAGAATSHCNLGQRLAINVSAASAAPAPQPATPPPSPAPATTPSPAVPAPGPSRVPVTYTVGDALGWIVPGTPIAYQVWARNKTFLVGDILVFNFPSGQNNVLEVKRAEFDSCNVTTTTTPPTTTPPARITLTSAGEHYYISTFSRECSLGQKLAINVTGGSSAPAPAPSSPSPAQTPSSAPAPAQTPSSAPNPPPNSGDASPPPPSTPSTPSPVTPPPPPPSSAPSVAVAALPFTFLAVALAFLV